jgi:protein tyrosine phosphatase
LNGNLEFSGLTKVNFPKTEVAEWIATVSPYIHEEHIFFTRIAWKNKEASIIIINYEIALPELNNDDLLQLQGNLTSIDDSTLINSNVIVVHSDINSFSKQGAMFYL